MDKQITASPETGASERVTSPKESSTRFGCMRCHPPRLDELRTPEAAYAWATIPFTNKY